MRTETYKGPVRAATLVQRPWTRPLTLDDLHRASDGFIGRDALDRAAGLDPVLLAAAGHVRFFRERVENAKQAWHSWVSCAESEARMIPSVPARSAAHAVVVVARRKVFDKAQAALARAEARLRLLANPDTAAQASLKGPTP